MKEFAFVEIPTKEAIASLRIESEQLLQNKEKVGEWLAYVSDGEILIFDVINNMPMIASFEHTIRYDGHTMVVYKLVDKRILPICN